jgi:tRNA(Ile2) C34 agmatinyltransferase TiaS
MRTQLAIDAKTRIVKPTFKKFALIGNDTIGNVKLMSYIGEGTTQVEDDQASELAGCTYVDKTVINRFDHSAAVVTLWQLGATGNYISLIPSTAKDCECVFYIFDLVVPDSIANLESLFHEYQKANTTALPVFVGINYQKFSTSSPDTIESVVRKARNLARRLRTGLVFVNEYDGTNINELFEFTVAMTKGTYILTPAKTSGPLLEYHYLTE